MRFTKVLFVIFAFVIVLFSVTSTTVSAEPELNDFCPGCSTGDFDIEVIPPNPTTSDSVRIKLSGRWGDSCKPSYRYHQIDSANREIYIRGSGGPASGYVCNPVLTNWEFTVTVGRLPAGRHIIDGEIVYNSDGSHAQGAGAEFFVTIS